MLHRSILCFVITCIVIDVTHCIKYEPNWESLDTRPIPEWYDDAKIGFFINWGVYSVPGVHDEWFWWWWKGPTPLPDVTSYMKKFYPPGFTYADFARSFRAEFYDPNKWRDIIVASGAKYVVLTTKHCEGFSMYPSNHSFNWNAFDVGPKQDLVGSLKTALQGTGVKFGVYHAMLEWFHPLYLQDRENNYKTQFFPKAKAIPEVYEIINTYKPELFWADAAWLFNSSYWNATDIVAWLYNESPVKDTVVTNDRWGNDTRCRHGGYWTCLDRYNPGKLVPHKWENSMTIDRVSWGFRKDTDLAAIFSIEELLEDVISTISFGGNILINVGPTPYGTIAPIYEERYRQLGAWLKVNGEGIYATQPWIHQTDSVTPKTWYTTSKANKKAVYVLFLNWPIDNQMVLGSVTVSDISSVQLLGSGAVFRWTEAPTGTKILFPAINFTKMPCLWAWTLKITLK